MTRVLTWIMIILIAAQLVLLGVQYTMLDLSKVMIQCTPQELDTKNGRDESRDGPTYQASRDPVRMGIASRA